MKRTRRFAAMIAAMALTATMAVPTMMSANATDVTIVKTADKAEHTYNAYQIFTGTYDATLGLKITGFGTGYNGTGLAEDTEFRALEITPAVTVDSFLGSKTDAASVAQAIEKLNYANESASADALAKILAKYIGSANATQLFSDTATDLAAGYWIVFDKYNAADDEAAKNVRPDATSKFILRVSGTESITITPKKSYPTVEKKVLENVKEAAEKATYEQTDKKWNDVADYNIGDAVPFKLYGTLPSTINDYTAYYYKFTDALGTQFDKPASITINIGDKTLTATLSGSEYTVSGDTSGEKNCRVKLVDGKLEISFEDIKKYYAPNQATGLISTDGIITVEYTAVLNNTANIGLDGQENKVDLEYSNNPNIEYSPNTSNETEDKPSDDDNGTPNNPNDDTPGTDKTPEDKVIVFTYEQDIKKIDAATKEVLANAVFTLSRSNGTDTEYAKVDSNNKLAGWTTTESEASELKTGADGICKIIGLDDGTYTLKEKTAPNGYNKINTAMTLKINATTANGQNWNGTASDALTNIDLTVSGDNAISNITSQLTGTAANNKGTVMAKVENEKGVNLPTTGGMGTKLFIAGGGITATFAAIYLVSKKRAKDED